MLGKLFNAMTSRNNEQSGFFVTFEGGDGSGKSTQVELVAERLRKAGIDPILTREPGGTELGSGIRQLLLHYDGPVSARSEALLYAADRANNIETMVRPALAEGRLVLQDRYLDSSVAYQGAGRELDPEAIRELSLWATDGLKPDLTILFDADTRLMLERVAFENGSTPDRLEAEDFEFHEKVRQQYLKMAAAEPDRWVIIDANQAPKNIAAQVFAVIMARWG